MAPRATRQSGGPCLSRSTQAAQASWASEPGCEHDDGPLRNASATDASVGPSKVRSIATAVSAQCSPLWAGAPSGAGLPPSPPTGTRATPYTEQTSTNVLPCIPAEALASHGMTDLSSNAGTKAQTAQRNDGRGKFMAAVCAGLLSAGRAR